MKKLLSVTLIAILSLAFVGCQGNKQSAESVDAAQSDSLRQVISQKDNEINDMMGTLNEIQDGFNEINAAENRVTIAKGGEGANKEQQIRENIQFIAKTMKHNRELIAKLRNQLKQSSVKGDALKNTLENLSKQLEEKDKQLQQMRAELDAKDIHITELDEAINNLHTNVNNLANENSKKSQVINSQDKQLNTAWFVFGTRKELKEQRIIEGDKVLQSNFNKNYFTKIDIRVDKEIKLYSKYAKVLTMHPSSSYLLQRDANKQYTLKITNPEIFWSTSKYLVILVK
ncbi:Cbp1 family collagen-binding glycoprotein adhesin [Hoylesella timonensis]|uniref:Lipoprotein n=1 Tax=Hoylesella timonensis S9-PR14 TaxID=1401062 RepID=A0A098YQP4_9BACT|nr:hypothetical protein [Hoylesella timonensis]KGI21577.1 hypothetical protein HMPREF9304_09600 [Hoylesella timonensis S9-PR14]